MTYLKEKFIHIDKDDEGISKPPKEALSFRAHLLEFLDRSTIHGIYDIYKVESIFLKLIIGLCFLLSAGYCTYQVVNTILKYLTWDVLTTNQVFTSVPAEFPVVAFCNMVRQYDSIDPHPFLFL